MNLSLNGLVWRSALRAVPESHRSEVLGTLTDCYGTKAPLREAFRTFTSGSRMNNRANASSPVDLWRIGVRNALTFSLAVQSGMKLARWRLPFEYKERKQSMWELVLALAVLVLAFCLATNRYSRIVAGLFASSSAAALLLRDSMSFGPKGFPHPFPFQVICAAMMMLASGLILALHKKHRWVCAVGFFALAGSQIVAWTNGTFLFSERWERYSLIFGAAYVTAFVALIVLSTRSNSQRSERRAWVPIAMGLFFALLANVADSTLLSQPVRHVFSQGLGLGIAIFLAVAASLLLIRPQLFLACLFALFINLGPVMPWRFSGEGVATPLALIGVCSFALAVGHYASKRGLRA